METRLVTSEEEEEVEQESTKEAEGLRCAIKAKEKKMKKFERDSVRALER